jgi:hypothetical protein
VSQNREQRNRNQIAPRSRSLKHELRLLIRLWILTFFIKDLKKFYRKKKSSMLLLKIAKIDSFLNFNFCKLFVCLFVNTGTTYFQVGEGSGEPLFGFTAPRSRSRKNTFGSATPITTALCTSHVSRAYSPYRQYKAI